MQVVCGTLQIMLLMCKAYLYVFKLTFVWTALFTQANVILCSDSSLAVLSTVI